MSKYSRYTELVDKYREFLITAEKYIWRNPEIGYKEWKTSAYLEERFAELGYEVNRASNIPGFTAVYDTGREGPTVAVMGELDTLVCSAHPESNPETGAVHACGHLVQVCIMLGTAAVMKAAGDDGTLCGRIKFVAVPAEETIDLEFRDRLIEQGVIKYVAGKIEFMYRGFFDDVDMAIMVHADSDPEKLFKMIDGYDGCITKHIVYKGVAAHAGGSPHLGVNALYAATLGIDACNSLRETFREWDHVRYHPIITQGGQAANAIPEIVKMDTYVRATTLDMILQTNVKINRALAASAAVGANVTIEDKPGNLPFHSSKLMNRMFEEVVEELFGKGKVIHGGWDTQSSDIGDLSSIMPVIQPLCMGAEGHQHGDDYRIADIEKAVINPTKAVVCLVVNLLSNNGEMAYRVIEEYKPLYTDKRDYFAEIDRIAIKKQLVVTNPDSSITLDFHNPNYHQKTEHISAVPEVTEE